MATASASPKVLAARRLQQDMRELAAAPPLPMQRGACAGSRWGMEATPRPDDIFVWDVVMVAASGPLENREIKMLMKFSETYPANPPDVQLLTAIEDHPNVFGGWICLDMLKDPEYYAKPYEGWSAAYRVSGVLLQLYGFLLVDEYVTQMGGNYAVRRKANRVKATQPLPQLMEQQLEQKPEGRVHSAPGMGKRSQKRAAAAAAAEAAQVVAVAPAVTQPLLYCLDDHLLRRVLENLSARDLLNCMGTAPSRLARVAADVKQRGDLECFYSRTNYTTAVLGYGVEREWYKGPRSGSLRSLVVRLDYLSLDAFVDAAVRRSAWNAPIDAFLPLYLNPQHGERSLRALPGCVAQILSKNQPASGIALNKGNTLPPRQLLTVLSQAMNSLVVEMVRLDKGDVPTHMSDAALRGFAHLHHLLVAVAVSPNGHALVAEARRNVEAFVGGGQGGRMRRKEACPDLGVLLVELMLVPKEEMPWSRFLPPFLRELLARQVMWALKPPADSGRSSGSSSSSSGEVAMEGCQCSRCVAARASQARIRADQARSSLARSTPSPTRVNAPARSGRPFDFGVVAGEDAAGDSWHSFERMRVHFESASTGLRVVQLTCWFGLELARPQSVTGIMQELGAVKRSYDECSGAPSPEALAAFHAHARTVMGTGSWGKALGGLRVALRCEPPRVGMKPDPRKPWAAALRQAVVDSWVAGYHSFPVPWGKGPPVARPGIYRDPAPPQLTPQPARARPAVDKEGWMEVVKTRRDADRPKQDTPKGPWDNCYGPDPYRLADVKRVFGTPFVDWEGPNKPVTALEL